MKHLKGLLGIGMLPALVACVTINIYFPEAAAEQAADQVIQEVWGTEPTEEQSPPPSDERLAGWLWSTAKNVRPKPPLAKGFNATYCPCNTRGC